MKILEIKSIETKLTQKRHPPLQFDDDEELFSEFLKYSIPVIIVTPVLQNMGAELLWGPAHQKSVPEDDIYIKFKRRKHRWKTNPSIIKITHKPK